MSLTKEYEELDKIRKEDGEKCAKHYKSVNLPGDRVMSTDGSEAKARIQKMKAEREKGNLWEE